jgi:uncharacterized protein YcbK (DUF882 family)
LSHWETSFIRGKMNSVNRRHFLRLMMWTGLISSSPRSVLAAIENTAPAENLISLYNPHTKESFSGVYRRNGIPVAAAVQKINQILRDIRTDEVKPMDPALLDLMAAIAVELNTVEPIHVSSGYRSQKTNDLLRRRNRWAAKESLHTKGQAADIRVPGQQTSVVRWAACKLKMGGVGYCPQHKFLHIDVGPVQYWNLRS